MENIFCRSIRRSENHAYTSPARFTEPLPSTDDNDNAVAIDLLACRLHSTTILYIPEGLPIPTSAAPNFGPGRDESHYWRFDIRAASSAPMHSFALSAFSFECPCVL